MHTKKAAPLSEDAAFNQLVSVFAKLGFSDRDALVLAVESIPVQDVKDLLAKGCPIELVAPILV